MHAFDDVFENKMYRDQAPQWGWPVSVAYTPYGIMRIDGEFGQAIRVADTMPECRKIAEFLIGCMNLHLTIKENLMLNLVNVMTSILSGERRSEHACTRACFKEYERTCCKRGFNKLADRFGYIPEKI